MREKFANHWQRLAGISQLPAHQHHQAKTKKQEGQTAKTVLNPDDLMVGGENIFAPPTKLVVFMFASVRVWIVMRFDRSRRIHFRRKLSFKYLEGSAVCKAEKRFRRSKNGAPAVLLANTFEVAPHRLGTVAAKRRCSTISTSALSEFPESRPCHNERCR